MRALAILGIVLVATIAVAVEPGVRRDRPRATVQSDDPDMDDEGENAEPEAPDEDQGFDDGRDVAPAPRGHGLLVPSPRDPSSPRGEEDEPSEPPEHAPPPPGAAEPASAMEPASPVE